VPTLAEQLTTLKAAQRAGVQSVRFPDGSAVEYPSQAELALAIAAVEAEITAQASGTTTLRCLHLGFRSGAQS